MVFLNVAMIGGILALTIPILIHLLNRQRPRVIRWGAMHLLEQVVRTQRKRLRIEQILLLFVRAMIPVLLALCMAAPVLTGCQNLSGGSRSSTVIVLDNSYSMSAGGANSSHVEATKAAMEILEQLPDGSDASVVMMAGGVAPLLESPTVRTTLLMDEIKKRTAFYGQADAVTSLETAARIMADMAQAKRDMIVITDFQRVSWPQNQAAALARLAQWRGNMTVAPSLTFIDVGKEAIDNLAITEVSFSKLIVGVGQKINIRANLKNFGGKSYPSLRIYLDVDGQRLGVTELTLGPDEAGQVLFTHTFTEPGSHVVRLFADGDAALVEDNEYLTAVQVLDRVPVLLVDGDPAPPGEPLKGETGFLATALQPYKEGQVDLVDLLETTTIRVDQFNAESMDGKRAVVLANVQSLTDDQLRALDGFVRGGGGLVMFAGNRVNGEWFNDKLFANAAGLAPARITAIAGSATDPSQQSRIATQTYTHSALTLFNDPRSGNLGSADIHSWFRYEAPADDALSTTMAQLETGDPFLIQKRHGEGTVILCATSCDADWNSLPARPFYVPLMQQLVAHVASNVEPPRNVLVGQPLMALLPRAMIGNRATLTDPAGGRHAMTVADRGSRGAVTITDTQQLGLYKLEFPGSGVAALHLVVSSPRAESDLRRLSDDEIRNITTQMGGELVTTASAYRELDQHRRHGSEIWHWFFWGVLALCFIELMLQYRFASSRV